MRDQAWIGRLGLILSLLLMSGCQGLQGQGSPTAAVTPPPAVQTAEAPRGATVTPAPAPTVPPAAVASTPAPTPTSAAAGSARPTTTSAPATGPAPADLSGVRLALDRVAGGLQTPIHLTHAGDGSGRLFVVEKAGRIRIVRDGGAVAQPFLDIRPLVGSRGSEQGLLGLAFHPDYKANGFFYVNYTDQAGDTVIARYQVSQGNPDLANPESARVILAFDQPYANHNGGLLLFGPDGYLWIGTGDGGSGGDPHGNGQNGQAILGKMLRIDVNGREPYGIPPDNPFVDGAKARPEVWALGLRNPWRYTFDRATGDLYIADVGQNAYEEINVTPAGTPGGLNYGWNRMEGAHCFRAAQGCDQAGLELPVAEYSRDKGCSVTGGHVYRGQRYPQLAGIYFYGDYCSGIIWGLVRHADGRWTAREVLDTDLRISTFGEDEAGEVYVANMGSGEILRLTQAAG